MAGDGIEQRRFNFFVTTYDHLELLPVVIARGDEL